jgi:hypothetical protein
MSVSDEEKFKRLAEKRVNNAIKYIRLVGNLSNKSNYSYTDGQVEKIFRALNREIKEAKTRFQEGDSQSDKPFHLD